VSKKQRKKKRGPKPKRHQVSKRELVADMRKKTLRDKLQEVYHMQDLRTSCCRQCTCCYTACPQMNYSEAVQILDTIWNEWSQVQKRELLATSVKYFFSNSVIKRCPMLTKMFSGTEVVTGCAIYDIRPLNCRMYGQWPADAYNARVDGFMSATGVEKEAIPLNEQCPHVRRISDDPLTVEMIEEMYTTLDNVDQRIGDFNDEQVERKHNKRAIHDWVLAKFWGEEKLAMMTDFFLAATEEEVEDFVKQFEVAVQEVEV